MRKAAQIIRRSLIDPDYFCREILRSENDPWQAEFMQAVADVDRIRLGYKPLVNPEGLNRFSAASCHGTGKTHTIAKLIHWYGFTHPRCRIPATAPKERQLITRTWPEFRKILGGAVDDYRKLVEPTKTKITWGGDPDWAALIEAASQTENLAGYHARFIMFVVEEASGVSEEMFPVIEGALSTDNAVLVMIGNPTKNHGEHYNSHNLRGVKDLYWRKQLGYQDSPRVSKKWAETMIRKYGRDSPHVQIRVLGNWAELDEYQLVTPLWIQDAVDRPEQEDGSHPYLRISVDVADGGNDQTVITAAHHYQTQTVFLAQHAFSFPASEAPIKAADAAERIFQAWGGNQLKGDDFVVDALGVGAGTAGTLLTRRYPVVTYRGGESSDDKTKWRNRRTQSYLVFRDALRDGTIKIREDFLSDRDDWDQFQAQLLSIRFRPGQERLEELETKQELLRRGLESPDRADSGAMQFATQTPTIGDAGPDIPILVGTLESEGYDNGVY